MGKLIKKISFFKPGGKSAERITGETINKVKQLKQRLGEVQKKVNEGLTSRKGANEKLSKRVEEISKNSSLKGENRQQLINDARKKAGQEKAKKGGNKSLTKDELKNINNNVTSELANKNMEQLKHLEELSKRYESIYGKKAIRERNLNKIKDFGSNHKKALMTTAIGGGLASGIYGAFRTPEEEQQEEQQEPESKYRWTPDGWEQNVNGNWAPQTSGYGVDRFGNTNFYDEQSGTWLKPGEYYQGSNGLVYTADGSRQIGYNDAATAAQNAGMGTDLFGYYAKSHNISPDDINIIKAIQQKLGVASDGVWGQQTENAYNKAISDNPSYFTIAQ